ncbi:MAG TPA: ABC transporter permease [Rhodospirillales bacterium]|nr:ABC transporter permease [Rhodospirillales bacterium]
MSGALDIIAAREVFSWRRVAALLLRHLYVLRRSWPRLLELAYWPTIQMLLWGFITTFFLEHSTWVAQAAAVLISAVLLWDVLFRSNLGVALSFIEEIWSRNLGQLFVSPLRPCELVSSLMIMSFIRTIISVTPAAFLAMPFYDVWVFQLGPPLIAFFANLLIMGWSVGLVVSALVLRFGMGAESLCWLGIFLVGPVSGIYYPIATLPGWLQPVAWALPSAYVFEGMRGVLFEQVFRVDFFGAAVALNLVYLALSCAFFLFMFHTARERGLLLQQGE